MKRRILSALCAFCMTAALAAPAWAETYSVTLTEGEALADVPVLLNIPAQTPAAAGEAFNRIEIAAPVPGAAVELAVNGSAQDAILYFLEDDGTFETAEEFIKGSATVCTMLPETSATLILLEKMPFSDVSRTAWYHAGAAYAYHYGLMNGTSSTKFSPNGNTVRAMLVTILWRTEGQPGGRSTFSDVAAGQYYTDAVAWAADNGIVTGYANGAFRPTGQMTREQLAAVLYRYAAYCGRDTSARADLSGFSDSGSVSAYAKDAMAWAVAEGLISGSGDRLQPGGTASRAQLAVILMRFFGDSFEPEEIVPEEPSGEGGETEQTGGEETEETPAAEA